METGSDARHAAEKSSGNNEQPTNDEEMGELLELSRKSGTTTLSHFILERMMSYHDLDLVQRLHQRLSEQDPKEQVRYLLYASCRRYYVMGNIHGPVKLGPRRQAKREELLKSIESKPWNVAMTEVAATLAISTIQSICACNAVGLHKGINSQISNSYPAPTVMRTQG